MNAVAPKQIERLGKILGRLGSAHEGERANAAALADRQLRDMGVSWSQLAERAFAVAPSLLPRPRPRMATDGERLRWLRARMGSLTRWEAHFTESLAEQAARGVPFSERQAAKLAEVAARVLVRRGNAA